VSLPRPSDPLPASCVLLLCMALVLCRSLGHVAKDVKQCGFTTFQMPTVHNMRPQGGKPFHFYSTDGEGVFKQVTTARCAVVC